jgi:hypothetical protein
VLSTRINALLVLHHTQAQVHAHSLLLRCGQRREQRAAQWVIQHSVQRLLLLILQVVVGPFSMSLAQRTHFLLTEVFLFQHRALLLSFVLLRLHQLVSYPHQLYRQLIISCIVLPHHRIQRPIMTSVSHSMLCRHPQHFTLAVISVNVRQVQSLLLLQGVLIGHYQRLHFLRQQLLQLILSHMQIICSMVQ